MINQDIISEDVFSRAKLLIKAAFWVSKMDPDGGREAGIEERKAMTEAMRRFQHEKDYILLAPVFEKALESYQAWDQWAADLTNFRGELKSALPDAPLVFRQSVYDLAYCVAIRYRERSWTKAILASIAVSLKNFFKPDPNGIELPAYLNISGVEKSALNELAEILELPQRIIN